MLMLNSCRNEIEASEKLIKQIGASSLDTTLSVFSPDDRHYHRSFNTHCDHSTVADRFPHVFDRLQTSQVQLRSLRTKEVKPGAFENEGETIRFSFGKEEDSRYCSWVDI